MGEGDTHSELSGAASNVVQGRDISGGIHFHHSAGADWPVPRQLPPDVLHFTDREAHLAGLHRWLDTPNEHIAPAEVIAGTGGVGKTSLAAHWAHQVRDRFPDGDLYLNLRGYHVESSVCAEEALDQLLRAFDIPSERIPVDLDAKAALYRSLLHGRRMLVLLDNAATEDQIRPLLPGSPTCRVLVTSRSQLAGLAVREGAHRVPMDVLPPESAIELLAHSAGAERIREDPIAAAELARYCGYLPLALRIAAERLVASPHLSVADLVEELAEARDRLDVLAAEEDEFTTLRAVFSWSYRALPPDAARMFRLLGLVAGPDVSDTAATALANISTAKARRLLDKLVSAHLLQVSGPHRFRLHDLLRVYAVECAETDELTAERQAAISRLLTWYTHSLDSAAHMITPQFGRIPMSVPEPSVAPPAFPDRLTALHWCDSEQTNLVSAVGQAAEVGEHTRAWQLAVALLAFFLIRNPLVDWVSTHRTGLASARLNGDRLAEAWLQTSIAIAHRKLKQCDAALECLEQALPCWRETGVRWGEAWALRDTGSVFHLLGRHMESIETLEQALALHLAENDAWGEATTLSGLAMAHHSVGQFDAALRELDQALAIRRRLDDHRNVASALSDLALVHDCLGQFDRAQAYGEEALAMHREVDYWHGEALAHERLGIVMDHTGHSETAQEHWRAAVTLYEELGDPHTEEIRHRLRSPDGADL